MLVVAGAGFAAAEVLAPKREVVLDGAPNMDGAAVVLAAWAVVGCVPNIPPACNRQLLVGCTALKLHFYMIQIA